MGRQRRMPNCVDTLMHSMPSPSCNSPIDEVHIKAQVSELRDRHDPVLPFRKARNHSVQSPHPPPTGRFPFI